MDCAFRYIIITEILLRRKDECSLWTSNAFITHVKYLIRRRIFAEINKSAFAGVVSNYSVQINKIKSILKNNSSMESCRKLYIIFNTLNAFSRLQSWISLFFIILIRWLYAILWSVLLYWISYTHYDKGKRVLYAIAAEISMRITSRYVSFFFFIKSIYA